MVPQPIPIVGMNSGGHQQEEEEQEGRQKQQHRVGEDPYLSDEMMKAIYGDRNTEDDKKKKHEYEESLRRWWKEYADRKNDEEDEYVANSLLYDRNHLPRSAPAPDCVVDTSTSREGHSHGDA